MGSTPRYGDEGNGSVEESQKMVPDLAPRRNKLKLAITSVHLCAQRSTVNRETEWRQNKLVFVGHQSDCARTVEGTGERESERMNACVCTSRQTTNEQRLAVAGNEANCDAVADNWRAASRLPITAAATYVRTTDRRQRGWQQTTQTT